MAAPSLPIGTPCRPIADQPAGDMTGLHCYGWEGKPASRCCPNECYANRRFTLEQLMAISDYGGIIKRHQFGFRIVIPPVTSDQKWRELEALCSLMGLYADTNPGASGWRESGGTIGVTMYEGRWDSPTGLFFREGEEFDEGNAP